MPPARERDPEIKALSATMGRRFCGAVVVDARHLRSNGLTRLMDWVQTSVLTGIQSDDHETTLVIRIR